MLTKMELQALQEVDYRNCDPAELVDMLHVHIEREKPVAQKMDAFLKAVHNPYLFKVGDIIVKVRCNPNGKPFADAVATCLMSC